MQGKWIEEFGIDYAIPAEILGLVERGVLRDRSWGNDAMPQFEVAALDGRGAASVGRRNARRERSSKSFKKNDTYASIPQRANRRRKRT